ncbi:Glutamate receptor 4, partial [Clarias magur]
DFWWRNQTVCGPSHSAQCDGAATLQCGAAAGEGHTRVCGQQGLPLGLETDLED